MVIKLEQLCLVQGSARQKGDGVCNNSEQRMFPAQKEQCSVNKWKAPACTEPLPSSVGWFTTATTKEKGKKVCKKHRKCFSFLINKQDISSLRILLPDLLCLLSLSQQVETGIMKNDQEEGNGFVSMHVKALCKCDNWKHFILVREVGYIISKSQVLCVQIARLPVCVL